MPSSSNFAWRLSLMSNEKPRFVIVGFQTDRSGSQEKNPSVFDHCDLRDISATLNGLKYPVVTRPLSFAQNNFAIPYRAASKFCENFYELNDIHYFLFHLFVFDVSKHETKDNMNELTVIANFNSPTPASTNAGVVFCSGIVR